jgi:two-component system NtrC family response regulator
MRARRDEIDLIILDIALPGASSRQVYEEARQIKPDLPVIVTSAKSEQMAGASLGTSVDHFLRKPFLSADLIDKIQKILASRANSRAAGSKASG